MAGGFRGVGQFQGVSQPNMNVFDERESDAALAGRTVGSVLTEQNRRQKEQDAIIRAEILDRQAREGFASSFPGTEELPVSAQGGYMSYLGGQVAATQRANSAEAKASELQNRYDNILAERYAEGERRSEQNQLDRDADKKRDDLDRSAKERDSKLKNAYSMARLAEFSSRKKSEAGSNLNKEAHAFAMQGMRADDEYAMFNGDPLPSDETKEAKYHRRYNEHLHQHSGGPKPVAAPPPTETTEITDTRGFFDRMMNNNPIPVPNAARAPIVTPRAPIVHAPAANVNPVLIWKAKRDALRQGGQR